MYFCWPVRFVFFFLQRTSDISSNLPLRCKPRGEGWTRTEQQRRTRRIVVRTQRQHLNFNIYCRWRNGFGNRGCFASGYYRAQRNLNVYYSRLSSTRCLILGRCTGTMSPQPTSGVLFSSSVILASTSRGSFFLLPCANS